MYIGHVNLSFSFSTFRIPHNRNSLPSSASTSASSSASSSRSSHSSHPAPSTSQILTCNATAQRSRTANVIDLTDDHSPLHEHSNHRSCTAWIAYIQDNCHLPQNLLQASFEAVSVEDGASALFSYLIAQASGAHPDEYTLPDGASIPHEFPVASFFKCWCDWSM